MRLNVLQAQRAVVALVERALVEVVLLCAEVLVEVAHEERKTKLFRYANRALKPARGFPSKVCN